MMQLIDTTLREGIQAPGVFFSPGTKKKILTGLSLLGVDEVELGVAVSGNPDLAELSDFMHASLPQQRFSLWCRCREEDIYFAAGLCPSVVSLSIPASDLHITKKLGKDRAWAVQTIQHAIKTARKAGIRRISVGLEDASRAEVGFVRKLALAAHAAGAFRLRLADTVGIADPVAMISLLNCVDGIDMEFGVHCHNDFGMATANSITALEHGADWADVTILGLGERAGNSRLEEVLSYLVFQKKIRTYNPAGLRKLSDYVAGKITRDISPTRPILGSKLFTCESGMHLQGLLADPATYEPYEPERIGRQREMRIGWQSGRHSVAATLKRLGVPRLDSSRLARVTDIIRRYAGKRKRPLDDHEIIRLAKMA